MPTQQTFLEAHILDLARRHSIAVPRFDGRGSVVTRTAADADVEALAATVRRLRRVMNDELFGMTSHPVPAGTFDFAVKSALHHRTLGELLLELIAAAETMYSPPDLRVRMKVMGDTATVAYENAPHPIDDLYFVWSMMSTHRGMCWLIDERIHLRRAEFRSRNAAHREDLQQIFQCRIVLGAAHNAIVFDRRYLATPIARHLGDVNDYLKRRPLDVLYIPGQDRSQTGKTLHLLRQRLQARQHLPHVQEVAAAFGLSSNRLRRQLAREGRTLQELKDRVRAETAEQQLTHSTLPIEQIATQLGFEEPNSFCRAFKRWSGVSPQAYRQRHSVVSNHRYPDHAHGSVPTRR